MQVSLQYMQCITSKVWVWLVRQNAKEVKPKLCIHLQEIFLDSWLLAKALLRAATREHSWAGISAQKCQQAGKQGKGLTLTVPAHGNFPLMARSCRNYWPRRSSSMDPRITSKGGAKARLWY